MIRQTRHFRDLTQPTVRRKITPARTAHPGLTHCTYRRGLPGAGGSGEVSLRWFPSSRTTLVSRPLPSRLCEIYFTVSAAFRDDCHVYPPGRADAPPSRTFIVYNFMRNQRMPSTGKGGRRVELRNLHHALRENPEDLPTLRSEWTAREDPTAPLPWPHHPKEVRHSRFAWRLDVARMHASPSAHAALSV